MVSLCLVCKHLRDQRAGRLTCDAFPLGVPRAIREGRADHRQAYPGDDGIRFEAAGFDPTTEDAAMAIAES